MRRRILTAMVCVLAFGFAAGASAPLAERLPAGSLAYIGWAGKTEAMDASSFGELLADPKVTQIVEELRQGLENAMPPGKPRAIFTEAWSMAAIAWKRPIALALVSLKGDEGEPVPSGAALIDLGEHRVRFAKHMESIIAAAGEDIELEEKEFLDVRYRRMAAPDGPPLSFGYMGDLFFVCIGEDVEKQIIGMKPARSLGANKEFAKSLAAVGGDGAQYVFYVDIDAVLRATGVRADEGSAERAGGEDAAEVASVINALGLGKMTTVAAATRFVDGGVHTKAKLFSPAPHAGLLKLAAGKPLAASDLAAVPADADYVCAMNLSASEAFAQIKQMLRKASPRDAREFEEGIGEAEEEIGVSFEQDIFASLGDTWVISGAESQGGFLTGTLLTVEVKDAERLKAAIARIEAHFRKQFGSPAAQPARTGPGAGWTCAMHPQVMMSQPGTCPICEMQLVPVEAMGTRRRRRRGGFDIRSMKAAGADVHYVSFGSGRDPIPVAPAWAVHGGKLYFALWPQVIAAALESGPLAAAGKGDAPVASQGARKQTPVSRSLIGSKEFQRIRSKVSDKASILIYVNARQIVNRLYPLLLAGVTAGANAAPSEIPLQGMQEWVPTLPWLRKYVGPYVAAVSADEDGIVYEEYASMPMQGLSSLGANPAVIAGMFWSVGRARGSARVAVSASNLHQIGMACMMYANDYDGMFPPDLSHVLRQRYIEPEVLVRPGGPSKAPRLVEGKLVGEVDYVYLGGGVRLMTMESPSETVLAHEKPWRRNGMVNVLFADGHVEPMTMEALQKAIQRTRPDKRRGRMLFND